MSAIPKIESYKFGEIEIDGVVYRNDVIVRNKDLISNWRRLKGHSLELKDLEDVLAEPPHVLVIGQGAYGRMVVPEKTRRNLENIGIQVITLPTAEACEEYNRLSKDQIVFAALHLTC